MARWVKFSGIKKAAYIFCVLIMGICSEAHAQKENTIWYFGNAGLDFNSGSPVPLTNSAMNAPEGTTSVVDIFGKLLFYSDGTTVWNKQHQVMENGDGLLGNSNSAQSCIIVQNPGKPNIFYLATTDATAGNNGLRYSTIDMSKNGGLGEVIEKNVFLYAPTSERLTAVHHRNGRDIWVISQLHGTSNFRSYIVTESGFAKTAENSGLPFAATSVLGEEDFPKATRNDDAIGTMKFSPDGAKVAVTHRATNTVRLFGYDNELSHLYSYPKEGGSFPTTQGLIILEAGEGPYGVEFSPDSRKLYVTVSGGTKIIQYDISSGDGPTIAATKKEVAQITIDTNTPYIGNSLQLGPDGKIYVARAASSHVGVINNPNASGGAINYVDKGVYLAGKKSMMGLPAFVQSSFKHTYEIKYTLNCFGQPSNFYFDAPTFEQPDFMGWNFGDPASGVNNTAGTLGANHNFSTPGKYTVTFTRHFNNKREEYSIGITIKPTPVVNLGSDRIVCAGTEVTLDATSPNATYKWSNGSTSASITTTIPGTYWAEVTIAGCTSRDEVTISHLTVPTVNLGADRELCEGETIELNAFNDGATYLWQDGSTNPTFTVTKAGTYTVEVTSKDGCKKSDSVTILYNPLPVVNLGPDRDICANTTTVLDATQPGMTYKWSTGATTPTITIANPGEYWVTLTSSKGCSATDVIRINHLPIPVVNLGPDETLCSGDTKLLNATYPNSTYLWQNGSTNPTFLVTEPGRYWVDVTNELGCVVRDEIWLPYLTRPAIALGNDTTLCYGDTLVIGTELPGGIRYEWQDGSTEPFFKVTKPGTYKLKAFNQHCEATDEITVKFKDCIGGLFIPNIITPNGDGKNDVFFIHGLTEDDWELVLFNRWGKEIQRIKNYKNDWAPKSPDTKGMLYYLLQHPTSGRSYKGWLEVVQ